MFTKIEVWLTGILFNLYRLVVDYQLLIEQHRNCFNTNKTLNYAWRIEQLLQIKKLVQENDTLLYQALSQDLGKPTVESWLTEVSYVAGEVDYAVKRLKRWMKPKRVKTPIVAQPGRSFIQAEPLGVVLIIGAWNYPVQLVLAPLVAAISAGNCAILKPSELSPAVSKVLADLVPKYLDPQAISVIEGAVEETTALLQLQFDHIMYTGNGAVARIIMAAAAKHLTPVTLELGGKSPVYVDETADIEITAQRIAWGKWLNAGQTCIAPDYILTNQQTGQLLIEALKKQIIKMFGSEPKLSDSYGRIVNERHCQRLIDYLTDLDPIIGGQHDLESKYIAPTVVLNPPLDSKLMTEEIFGAILPILIINNFNEAKSFIRKRDKPLSAYLFSKDEHQQQSWVNEISAGSQCLNDVIMFNAVPELPFGGVGPSGFGQYSGKAGFDNFSHQKSVLKRPFIKDLPIRFAPYTKLKLLVLKMVRHL